MFTSRSRHFLYFVFFEISGIQEVYFDSGHHNITALCRTGSPSYHNFGYSKYQKKPLSPMLFFSNGQMFTCRSRHFLYFVFLEISGIQEVDLDTRHHRSTAQCHTCAPSYHKLRYSKYQEKPISPMLFFSNGQMFTSRSGHFLYFVFLDISEI